jgi:hypothetical protein
MVILGMALPEVHHQHGGGAVTEISPETITPENVPAEWVEAATRHYSMHGSGLIRNILAGVAPLIAAAERERVTSRPLVLVWRDERGTEICRSAPIMPGTVKIGIPLDAQSADLITEPPTRTEGPPK